MGVCVFVNASMLEQACVCERGERVCVKSFLSAFGIHVQLTNFSRTC